MIRNTPKNGAPLTRWRARFRQWLKRTLALKYLNKKQEKENTSHVLLEYFLE